MDKLVRGVWKVSLDTCGRTPGGGGNADKYGVRMVGACGGDQGREYITRSGLAYVCIW